MRDITLGDTLRHHFTTRAFATGIPGTLGGTPVLSVLEESNATPITAGVSISVDRASVVGLNEATIVATGGNGYETGKSYSIYISTGTVDGVSVIGEVVGSFTVEKSSTFIRLGAPAGASIAADLVAIEAQTDDIGVAGAGLTALPISDANLTQIGGVAQSATDLKDFADVGYDPATNKITGCLLTDTVTANTDMRGTDSAALATVCSETRLSELDAGTGGKAANQIDLIKTEADKIALVDAGAGVAGSVIEEVENNAASISGLNDLSAAQVNTEVDTALSDISLDKWVLTSGTATSGSISSLVDTSRTDTEANRWRGAALMLTSGVMAGEIRQITTYNEATDTFSFSEPFTSAVTTETYIVIPSVYADVRRWLGTTPNILVDNNLPCNIRAISGDTVAADNLESDYDGTGYAKANSTIGTCTANTDMRGTDSAALASVCTEGRLAELDGANLPSDIDAILTDTAVIGVAGLGLTDLGGMSTGMKGEVNAEVVDVLKTDTIAQLSQQLPPSAPTFEEAIMYLYQYFRNRRTQTSSTISMFAEDETTVIAKSTISDDATTAVKGEFGTGP